MLNVSSWKGVFQFKNKGKLSSRFVGPFNILKRVGEVAYVLELPEERRGINNTFHVSYLRKCLADESSVITVDDIKIDPELTSREEAVTILGKKLRQLRNKVILLFWNTAVVKHSVDVTRLQALVDKKRIVITEEVIREILQLNDAEVVTEVVPPTLTPPSPPSPVLDTCSVLARRVEGLENDKAAQQLEIVKLKARVKKLEKINMVKSSKLRRLKKDEGIELVVDHEKDAEVDQEKDAEFEGRHADKQAEIYNIDLDHSSKVLSMKEDDTEVQKAIEIVTIAKLMTEVVTAAATQVVAAGTPIPAAKP
nr:hypothetical protein [Tanacetum cinerariifolium]